MTGQHRRLSAPARPDRDNEDAVWTGDGVVVLVDGAGLPQELRAGCRHSVTWFARTVADELGRRLTDRSTRMRQALHATISAVAGSHRAGCDLGAGSPSATAAAWRTHGDQVELLVLCDSSLILVGDDGPVHLSDDRLAQVTAPRVEAALAADRRDGIPVDGRRRADHQRTALEATRNVADGFWCVHTDPAAAEQAVIRSVPRSQVSHVIMASDGATRAIDDLGTHTLEEFVADCVTGRLEQLRDTVRAAEVEASDRLRDRGSKIHDDLTVSVTEVGGRAGLTCSPWGRPAQRSGQRPALS